MKHRNAGAWPVKPAQQGVGQAGRKCFTGVTHALKTQQSLYTKGTGVMNVFQEWTLWRSAQQLKPFSQPLFGKVSGRRILKTRFFSKSF